MNATQLVIGVSRRGRIAAALTGPGIGATVIRESGVIDVHIVTHSSAGGAFTLPRLGGSLSLQRRIVGAGSGSRARAAGHAAARRLPVGRRPDQRRPGAPAARRRRRARRRHLARPLRRRALGVDPRLLLRATPPQHHDRASRCTSWRSALYVVNALLVSYVVDQAARRSRSAARAFAESELLATIAGSVLRGQDALQALLVAHARGVRADERRGCLRGRGGRSRTCGNPCGPRADET